MVTVDPLFSDPEPLFKSEEPSTTSAQGVPLFGETGGRERAPQPAPLFDQVESAVSPLFQAKPNEAAAELLFKANESPAVRPPELKPEVLFNPDEPAKIVPRVTEVGPAFAVIEDPLVLQTLGKIEQDHPEKKPQERLLKGLMIGLFPLDFDRIAEFAAKAIREQQAIASEAKRITDLHLSLDVTATIDHIMQEAKNQHQPKAHGFLQKLKTELESTLKTQEGPAQWYARLHTLRGSLKLVATEAPTVLQKGGECLDQLTDYALILKALVPSIRDRSLNDAAGRRLTLLLGAIQQIQISVKSLEQAQTLIRNQLQQIDEAMTITLPALGYTL
ncbi:hypothetical protein [Acidithiobacillus thiooxidans]|uniref:hypothetical protein n=1 Tax=Acidithiobacillus thiooxidans TaxID=930 RepID=UPI0004E0FD89|nr:hypothetical protein [Acidithiobacillus thiooxidans]